MNCNASLIGRFCHICGQENLEPAESAWGLISHFFYDITHFDGKFFSSLKWLITKPGLLSKEYIKGRRSSYLNPVKMYVFTSALFFILFFSFFFNAKKLTVDEPVANNSDSIKVTNTDNNKEALKAAPAKEDSATISKVLDSVDKIAGKANPSTNFEDKVPKRNVGISFSFDTTTYTSVVEYDSLQKLLPANKRDGWFKRMAIYKQLELNPEYKKDQNALFQKLLDKFMHYFPQILFLSLPLIALGLQLLYIRRRKQFYYVSHGIVLIHVYIYSFINLLLYFLIEKLKTALHWNWLSWLQVGLVLHSVWYVYRAMRIVYGQSRIKTISKFLLLNLFTFIIISLLFVFFFLVSALNL